MTGKQRITAALEGRPTDSMATNMLFYDGYIASCAGRRQWEFDYGSVEDQFEMQLAAIRRHPANDSFWTWTGMNRGPIIGVRIEFYGDEPHAVFEDGSRKLLIDNPANGMWNRSPEEEDTIYQNLRVQTVDDICSKHGAILTADSLIEFPGYEVLSKLAQEVGDETFLWLNHSSLFAHASSYLGGPTQAWIATMENTELLESVLDYLLMQHLEYVRAGAKGGAHGVRQCYMNEGTNILSPNVWRGFLKPRYARIVEEAHKNNLKYVVWFLDDCRELVPDLIEIGIDGLATEQPRANYSCEPGDLRKAAGDSNLCIFGWFWEEDLLNGDLQSLRRTLAKQYWEAGGDKPFVVSTPGLTQEFDPCVVDAILEEAANVRD